MQRIIKTVTLSILIGVFVLSATLTAGEKPPQVSAVRGASTGSLEVSVTPQPCQTYSAVTQFWYALKLQIRMALFGLPPKPIGVLRPEGSGTEPQRGITAPNRPDHRIEAELLDNGGVGGEK